MEARTVQQTCRERQRSQFYIYSRQYEQNSRNFPWIRHGLKEHEETSSSTGATVTESESDCRAEVREMEPIHQGRCYISDHTILPSFLRSVYFFVPLLLSNVIGQLLDMFGFTLTVLTDELIRPVVLFISLNHLFYFTTFKCLIKNQEVCLGDVGGWSLPACFGGLRQLCPLVIPM